MKKTTMKAMMMMTMMMAITTFSGPLLTAPQTVSITHVHAATRQYVSEPPTKTNSVCGEFVCWFA